MVSLLAILNPMALLAQEGVAEGDTAPNFQLPGSDGKTYELSQFAGNKAVVVAWYPKAFTGG
jgi:peroxiredoxin Q/BCP